MKRLVAASFALALAGCGSVQANPPQSHLRTDGPLQAAIGSPMVDNRSTTVTVTALVQKPRVDGLRADFVYLGFSGSDPAARNTIRVRYEEYLTKDGVESERVEYRAEIDLDLSRSKVLEWKGWRIQVIEATDSAIRYEVVGSPAR